MPYGNARARLAAAGAPMGSRISDAHVVACGGVGWEGGDAQWAGHTARHTASNPETEHNSSNAAARSACAWLRNAQICT